MATVVWIVYAIGMFLIMVAFALAHRDIYAEGEPVDASERTFALAASLLWWLFIVYYLTTKDSVGVK